MIFIYIKNIPAYILILLIKIFQLIISPILKPNCRYMPTCSEYTVLAIKEHGLIIGIYYSIKRIFSCHPLGKYGYDPVPKKIFRDK